MYFFEEKFQIMRFLPFSFFGLGLTPCFIKFVHDVYLI